MKTIRWVWALVLLLGLAACSSTPEKSYRWSHFDSHVQVQPDGTLDVTETVTLRLSGGPFTFAYRDLPDRRLDAISAISVSSSGRSFSEVDDEDSEQPLTFSVFEHEGDRRIRWVYPETSDSEATFQIHYQVAGAVRRYDDHAEVWWSLVPPNRDELVEQSNSQIELPSGVEANAISASTPDVAGDVRIEDSTIFVTGRNIASGQELTARVEFPLSAVSASKPQWQVAEEQQAEYNRTTRPTVNVIVSAVAAGLALLLGIALRLWWLRNRDPRPQGFVARELPDKPDDLAPAFGGKLLRNGDATLLLGTLLDLARRGHVSLHEGDSISRWNKSNRLYLQRQISDDRLAPFELELLNSLFDGEAEVELQAHDSGMIKIAKQLGERAQAALIERGILTQAGLAQRKRGIIWGVALMIIGGIALVPALILAERYSWWLPALALVLDIAGLIWLIMASQKYGVSQSGADALARWRAYRSYLSSLKPERTAYGGYPELLPYATVLGASKQLTSAYSTGSEPLPVWYYPAVFSHHGHAASISSGGGGSGGGGGSLLLQDFSQNFLSSLNSVSSSASAASSSGGGAGGGGASGGGGAGAG